MITVADDGSGKNTIACLGANQECGKEEILTADRYLTERSDIGIMLIQNEVNRRAITGVATIAQAMRKLVIYKAAPVFKGSDVPTGLLPLINVICVNEFEAPILLGWTESGPFPLSNLRECRKAAMMLHHTKRIPVVIVRPLGHPIWATHSSMELHLYVALRTGVCS